MPADPACRAGGGRGDRPFQALTQIQEATLIYAPKIISVFLALLLLLPLMGSLLATFMHEIINKIAAI